MQIIKKNLKKKLSISLELTSNSFKTPDYCLLLNGNPVDVQPSIADVSDRVRLARYSLEFVDFTGLEIRLTNKSDSDTIMKDGKIVEDLNLAIKELVIDGLPFTDKLDKCFDYLDSDGQQHQTYGFMHRNGSMKMVCEKNILYMFWITSFT